MIMVDTVVALMADVRVVVITVLLVTVIVEGVVTMSIVMKTMMMSMIIMETLTRYMRKYKAKGEEDYVDGGCDNDHCVK